MAEETSFVDKHVERFDQGVGDMVPLDQEITEDPRKPKSREEQLAGIAKRANFADHLDVFNLREGEDPKRILDEMKTKLVDTEIPMADGSKSMGLSSYGEDAVVKALFLTEDELAKLKQMKEFGYKPKCVCRGVEYLVTCQEVGGLWTVVMTECKDENWTISFTYNFTQNSFGGHLTVLRKRVLKDLLQNCEVEPDILHPSEIKMLEKLAEVSNENENILYNGQKYWVAVEPNTGRENHVAVNVTLRPDEEESSGAMTGFNVLVDLKNGTVREVLSKEKVDIRVIKAFLRGWGVKEPK